MRIYIHTYIHKHIHTWKYINTLISLYIYNNNNKFFIRTTCILNTAYDFKPT